jgi:ATP-dependent RNA helicase DeaD
LQLIKVYFRTEFTALQTFEDLGLPPDMVETLSRQGIITPTEIQAKSIPMLLQESSDFVGLAQTGTGKTAAFGLPLIYHCSPNVQHTQALVLAPTRELAMQIAEALQRFDNGKKGLKIEVVYGGSSIGVQIKSLRSRQPHILVATPGRLIDLRNRGVADLKHIQFLVLDEADEMLNMGFKEDIDTILSDTPKDKNTWLFSATMPREIKRISETYMHSPREVRIDPGQSTNANITHLYALIKRSDKTTGLKRLLDVHTDFNGIIFTRTKREAQQLAGDLADAGYPAEALHGDMSQDQRETVMKRFKNGALSMLVATDVAARGIDVNDLTHVIHYHLPDDAEYYTHRSGRTARAGKMGISLALAEHADIGKLRRLEKMLKINFERFMVPTLHEVISYQVEHLTDKMLSTEASSLSNDIIGPNLNKLKDITKEELFARWISFEMMRLEHDQREDVNASERQRSDRNEYADYGGGRDGRRDNRRSDRGGDRGNERRGGRPSGRPSGDFMRFVVELGRNDNVNKGELIRKICEQAGLTNADLGSIQIRRDDTLVDVSAAVARGNKHLNGLRIRSKILKTYKGD